MGKPHSSFFIKVFMSLVNQSFEKYYTFCNVNVYPQNERFGLTDTMKLSSDLKIKTELTDLLVYKPAYVPISSPESDAPCCSNVPCDIGSMFWGLNSRKLCTDEHRTRAGGTRILLSPAEDRQKVAHRRRSHFS